MIVSRANKVPSFCKKILWNASWFLHHYLNINYAPFLIKYAPTGATYTALFLMFSLLMFLFGWKTGAEHSRSPPKVLGAALASLGVVPCNQLCVLRALLLPFLSHMSCHLLDFHLTWPFLTLGNWQMKERLVWNRSFGSEFFKFADKLSGWILPLPQEEKLTVIPNLQPAMTIVFEAQCRVFPQKSFK